MSKKAKTLPTIYFRLTENFNFTNSDIVKNSAVLKEMFFYYARLDGSGWNTLFESLIKTFKKLQALGHTYYNGKIAIIQSESEEKTDV